jgi:hypothetical protein
LDGLAFEPIVVEASWLEHQFESEILQVVKGMNNDKVPSPDGFSKAFFQALLGLDLGRHYGGVL